MTSSRDHQNYKNVTIVFFSLFSHKKHFYEQNMFETSLLEWDYIRVLTKWLLLATSLPAKLGLVFVLTLENAFSYRFHFKVNRKSVGSPKKTVLGIFKMALRLRDLHVFM